MLNASEIFNREHNAGIIIERMRYVVIAIRYFNLCFLELYVETYVATR